MKRLFGLILVLLAGASFLVSEATAEIEISPYKSKREMFSEIKQETNDLLRENQKLEAEYQSVKREYLQLKGQAERLAREVESLRGQSNDGSRFQRHNQVKVGLMEDQLGSNVNDLMIKESQLAFLSSQLLDLEESHKLWKLQLADLQYAKRKLEMDYKVRNQMSEAEIQEQEQLRNELRQDLTKALEKEKNLELKLSELQQEGTSHDVTIRRLNQEIKALERKKKKLGRKVDFEARENSTLKGKKMLVMRSFENRFWRTEKERNYLSERVAALEAEYQELDKRVSSTMNTSDEKQKILDDIIRLDKENQDLKREITEVTEQIKALK